jgi:hypothetical protein
MNQNEGSSGRNAAQGQGTLAHTSLYTLNTYSSSHLQATCLGLFIEEISTNAIGTHRRL